MMLMVEIPMVKHKRLHSYADLYIKGWDGVVHVLRARFTQV